jgi:hypothetical protein
VNINWIDPLFFPAYALEQAAFNPKHQPKNQIHREVLARIAAVAAPILYLYQAILYRILAVFSNERRKMDWHQEKNFSFQLSFYSTLEIPEKLIFGPNKARNYSDISTRYAMTWVHPWNTPDGILLGKDPTG